MAAERRLSLGAHWWVRLAMYGMLGFAAVFSVIRAGDSERLESLRTLDAEIISIATTQNALTERIVHHATLLVLDPSALAGRRDELNAAIADAQLQANRLDDALREDAAVRLSSHQGLREAYADWLTVRGQVWEQARAVGWYASQRDQLGLKYSMQQVMTVLPLGLGSAERLREQAQAASSERSRATVAQLQFWTWVTLAALLVMAVGVAEPVARAVRRQYRRLSEQSQQFERLALVAERTTNWVMMTDPQRRVIWANQAALRGLGLTLEQAVGRTLLSFMAAEGNDLHEIGLLTEELDRGLGVRMQVLAQSQNGLVIWVDADYQPSHDETGAVTGFLVVGTDITERVNQSQKMRALFDALPTGVVVRNKVGEVVDCNAAASLILGHPRERLLGKLALTDAKRALRDDLSEYPVAERPTMRTLTTGKGLRGESMGIVGGQGQLRWVIVNTEPQTDAQGRLAGVVTCLVDVTEQRLQQQLLKLAIEGAGMGTWQWELTTGEMTCSDRLISMIGHTRDTCPTRAEAWAELVHPEDLPVWSTVTKQHFRSGQAALRAELRVHHANGYWTWVMLSGAVVARDLAGQVISVAGVSQDINAQKQIEEQLRQNARTDGLTQMPNRAVVLERVREAIDRSVARPGYHFAVLFMDFDRFKQVNDTLGHGAGDELLRQIAQRLEHSLRPGDAYTRSSDFSQLAARIGGDEFVVVLDDIRGDLDAELVAARLLEVLAQPYEIGPNRVSSSVSIGVVTSTHAAQDVEAVLRDADIAMYEAKRGGRGRYVMFEPAMHKRVRDDVSLENDLRQALSNRELFVVYQPLVDLRDGRLAGMEALIRWRQPQRGMVSPVTFIPVAEACGLIGQIGQFVLRTACAEFASLRARMGVLAPPTVSVNLSRAQLREEALVADIQQVLRTNGMEAAQLQLEITESLAAQDNLVQAKLRDIKALGVTLALDDFGTGYSSLSCLHELPIDTVKIDRAFVSVAQHSAYHRVLIEATILMAETLGMSTVAEGIETEDQADLMKTLRCGKGQGYLFSKPLTTGELAGWIEGRTEFEHGRT
ncbi:EAL domain-containing protein [Rhodoferax sp.]|uniref:sensor domain-containing protein n=1 Tax=Rhodoferax sp. TaxID=50421 RepID=UPI00276E2EC7|nr:EAL domain-containing protein [Rhodoferax sp.]